MNHIFFYPFSTLCNAYKYENDFMRSRKKGRASSAGIRCSFKESEKVLNVALRAGSDLVLDE